MPMRFRRTKKLLPGVRLNLGKRGASVSFGPPGAHVTVGPHGTRKTVGIPGTGLSYTSFSAAPAGARVPAGLLPILLLGLAGLVALLAVYRCGSPALPASSILDQTPTVVPSAVPEGTEAADLTRIAERETARAMQPATEAADVRTPTASATFLPPTPSRTVAAPSPTVAAPVANTAANLRAGPGTEYAIVGAALAGQALQLVASSADGQWRQLTGGRWIYASLVDRAPAGLPVVAVAPPPTAPPTLPTLEPSPVPVVPAIVAPPPAQSESRSCCKVCRASKACGDSCISASKQCHKGGGCACQG